MDIETVMMVKLSVKKRGKLKLRGKESKLISEVFINVNEDQAERVPPLCLPESAEGFTEEEIQSAKAEEYQSFADFKVFREVRKSELSADDLARINAGELISCKWVPPKRKASGKVRCRLVCRGFNEPVTDKDETYASTPGITSLKLLLNHVLNKNLKVYVGDISTAFLHAPVSGTVIVKPPSDYVPKTEVQLGDQVL